MERKGKIFAVVAALALAVPVAVIAQTSGNSVPVYFTYYYSDATHQTQVGQIYGDCAWANGNPDVQYTLTGQQTPYSEDILFGYCGPNGWEPIT